MPGSDAVIPNLEERHWAILPDGLRGGMERYVMHGIDPGDFMCAVICNDLKEAAFRADVINFGQLGNIAKFVYWHTPWACQGSKERMEAWAKTGGLEGIGKSDEPKG